MPNWSRYLVLLFMLFVGSLSITAQAELPEFCINLSDDVEIPANATPTEETRLTLQHAVLGQLVNDFKVETLLSRAQQDNALKLATQTLEADPDFTNVYLYRGCVYSAQGELAKALADFRQFMVRSDDDALVGQVAQLFFAPVATSTVSTKPQTLEQASGDWEAAMRELWQKGVFPSGGELIFEDASESINSTRVFTLYQRDKQQHNFVLAGSLQLVAKGKLNESCVLMMRSQVESTRASERITEFVSMGINRSEFDYYSASLGNLQGFDNRIDTVNANVDATRPTHFLAIVEDDVVAMYVDGKLMRENFKIRDDTGIFALTLYSDSNRSTCKGSHLWAYSLPEDAPETCEIRSTKQANLRAGPGTNFDRAGVMDTSTVYTAVARATDSQSFTWWQLDEVGWVRADLVDELGACFTLPEESA